MLRSVRLAVAAGVIALAAPALADDVTDSIAEGLEAYEAGDMTAAKQALDYASQLIAQKNAEGLSGLLPEPLSGWDAEDADTQAMGAAMFGGGIQASRTYRKDGETVEVQIVGDSPLLAQWMPMLANPAMAGAMGKMVRIGKVRAIQGNDGQITMVVANRFLVTVGGSAEVADKMAYAQAIDLAALEGL